MIRTFLLFFFLISSLIGNEHSYFSQIEQLKIENRWEEIVFLGEEALQQALAERDAKKAFVIADQLVSTYFKMGKFDLAKEKGDLLVSLGKELQEGEFVVDSLYKLSAVFRGEKDFARARELAELALTTLENLCPKDLRLKGRVLFNLGAAHADDPEEGDYEKAAFFYREALTLFKGLGEEDYTQRTAIRLGKACLLIDQREETRALLDGLKPLPMEERTRMHLLYLEAQLLQKEGNLTEAIRIGEEALVIAVRLKAEADSQRIEEFISEIERN